MSRVTTTRATTGFLLHANGPLGVTLLAHAMAAAGTGINLVAVFNHFQAQGAVAELLRHGARHQGLPTRAGKPDYYTLSPHPTELPTARWRSWRTHDTSMVSHRLGCDG